jgi:acyl transferase domain-containing protein/NADPH:quinone reductase-like Zn-dependent oxidoreductase/acyl carrier protein
MFRRFAQPQVHALAGDTFLTVRGLPMHTVEPIAIIGISCRFPGGVRNPDDLWALMVGGVDAITEVPEDRWHLPPMYHPDPSKTGRMYSRWGGFMDQIDRFDAEFFGITPRDAATADPQQRILLEVAYGAIEDAGLTLAGLAGRQVGVYVGIYTLEYNSWLLNEHTAIDAYTSVGSMMCAAANRISYCFNLVGPSLAVDTACSSSLVATHLGCRSIWNGESELAFVAGVNLILRPETTIACCKASMLSPDGRCKSFDARANGFVRSEGAGVVILKPLSRALADRNHIYALILGTAVNQDGRTDGLTVPSQTSQEANLRAALRSANVPAESVQYVEAHGTGTAVGDPIEATALGTVYGKARKPNERLLIGSIKSNIGHLEAAAGIAGLIKTALCLKHRQIPANLHFENPNPQIPFDELQMRVAQSLEPWPESSGHPLRAGVNSFGAGGTNAHAILEAAPEAGPARQDDTAPVDGPAWLLPLSARSAPVLPDLARSYLNTLRNGSDLNHAALRDICFSASATRSHHDHRFALVAHDKAEMAEQLEAFLRGETGANCSSGRMSGELSRPVFICSGMGQQWWAMGRELLTQEPVYRRAVEELDELYRPLAGWSVIDKLLADENDSEVQQTHVAQPAIFATQVGLAALWRSWGVEPGAVLGHSAGEVAASYIAGALLLKDAVLVIFQRSRLLRRTVGQGAMLAAGIPVEEAALLVGHHPRAISIAAVNAERSVTLSGDASVLADINEALTEAGTFSRLLQVEAPFHSQKMEQIETELVESLRKIRPQPASTPFVSTVTGTPLLGTELDGGHWYRNTRQPVLFSDAMAEVIKAGHRVFIEIGAHPVLRYDIASCMQENTIQGTTLCSIRRGDRERAAMLGSLGRLYTLGAKIDWRKIFPADATAIKLPSYPFQAQKHWRESEPARRLRVGALSHPLLGNRQKAPQPTWQVELDTTRLTYLEDHRVNGSIVFPGSAYVEMALAAARESFGPVPCILEDVEFQKLLVLDQDIARTTQVVLDTESSEFAVHVQSDPSDNSWNTHARGYVRPLSGPVPAAVDLAQIRRRCLDAIDRDSHYRMFSDMGLDYGPTFRGIVALWRGDREALAELRIPHSLGEQASGYRLHPAVLDACFHSAIALLPAQTVSQIASGTLYLPVKIERFRFHAAPPDRLFAHAKLRHLAAAELTIDIELLDDNGNKSAEVHGLVVRPTGQRLLRGSEILYEYQWKPKPRSEHCGQRDASHLPLPETLAPIIRNEAETLQQRLGRARFEIEFRSLSRATSVAYIVRALRELGWSPAAYPVTKTEELADRLGIAPQFRQWLMLILKELTPQEMASTDEPGPLWRTLWNQFPECQAEATLCRVCGEKLADVLQGRVDPLHLIFPEGSLTTAEHLYQDSPTLRLINLLVQKAVSEIVARLPKGKRLRILEVGGGTGGIASFLLPVLSAHCVEYVFTDVSSRFVAQAQRRFAQYSVQYQTLDLELDPSGQGFDPHSFDLIIAFDVLHATKSLRQTLGRIRQLLASSGMLILGELTHPWMGIALTFALLPGWWAFEDHDLRTDGPCLPLDKWQRVLCETGFTMPVCVADCPSLDIAQHAVMISCGPKLVEAPASVPEAPTAHKTWLLFIDDGIAVRPSAGAQLAVKLRDRGDRVIEARHGAEFQDSDELGFAIRPGNPDDMRRVTESLSKTVRRLAGVVHLWSLDIGTSESMTNDALVRSERLGSISVMQFVQAATTAESLVIEGVWLVTHAVQPLEDREHEIEVAQAPLWGFGRVVVTEHPNLRCRLVDLATCRSEEIESLVEELSDGEQAEGEIALHGELRYVNRLARVSPTTIYGLGRRPRQAHQPIRIELKRPGILDSLTARHVPRTPPRSDEIEIEVAATGLNFKDLMLATGMLPAEATADGYSRYLPGFECSGRVVAVGDEVTEFAVGDEVVAGVGGSLGTHSNINKRFVALKPGHLTFEQAATIPVAFNTAYYSLHTLGRMQRGERVLIHSAAGGVGLAAVQLALNAGAVVFATAGSPEKRELLTALGVPHVMDSRTLAFADEIRELTDGEGVDLVLNSLAGEAIDKSLSILRPSGRFVEIGKTDIYKNRKIGMWALRNNISMLVVDLLNAIEPRRDLITSIAREMIGQFERHELHALSHRVFPIARLAEAFRFMAQAKHVGKLVVSMQDAAGLRVEDAPQTLTIHSDASYLITGGLGGLGLAVADRLARLGARRIALVGRSAPSTAAQVAVDALRRSGVTVMVCQADIANREQAQRLLGSVQQTIGPLRGIMHAAMVLDDASIEGITEERMWNAMAPKILGAWNLHALTNDVPLDFLVLFSSMASIIGGRGQANYTAGCAYLDSLAYYRRARGLPALVVNWGWVGDAGHVAVNPEAAERLDRLGIKAVPLSESLDTLFELMGGNAVQVAVAQVDWRPLLQMTFSSSPARFADLAGEAAVREDHAYLNSRVRDILESDAAGLPALLETYIRDHLARAMGASPSGIDMQQSLLSLGLDSLIAVEVRNRVNADLGINLPLAKFMQGATISTLAAYIAERVRDDAGPKLSNTEAPATAESLEPGTPASRKRVPGRIGVPLEQEVAAT